MDFLNKVIFDNTIKSYLIVFTIISVAVLLRNFISKKIAYLLLLLLKKYRNKPFDEAFRSLTIKPLSWFVLIAIVVLSIEKLAYPTQWNFKLHGYSLQDVLGIIGTCAIIVSFFYFVISLVNFIANFLTIQNAETDRTHWQVVKFFSDLLKIIIAIIAILCIFKYAFNQPVGPLLAGLGLVGAAIALAAKESIENLIASFIIFFDKPFFIGDLVNVHNITGTVEYVGLRSTKIRTLKKTLVTMPNKQMVDAVLDNWSKRTHRIAEIKITLSEKSNPTNLTNFIAALKQYLPTLQQVVMSSVYFTEYTKEGATIVVMYSTEPNTMDEYNELKQQVNLQVMQMITQYELETAAAGVAATQNLPA